MQYKLRITLWDQYDRKRDKRPEYEYSEAFDLESKDDALSCLKEAWRHLTQRREVRLVQAVLDDAVDAVDADELFGSSKPARRSSKKSAK